MRQSIPTLFRQTIRNASPKSAPITSSSKASVTKTVPRKPWANMKEGGPLEFHVKVHSLLRNGKAKEAATMLNFAYDELSTTPAEDSEHLRIHRTTTYVVARTLLESLSVNKLDLPALKPLEITDPFLGSSKIPAMAELPLSLFTTLASQLPARAYEEFIPLMINKGMYLESMLLLEHGQQLNPPPSDELWRQLIDAIVAELSVVPEFSKHKRLTSYAERSAALAASRLVQFRYPVGECRLPTSIKDNVDALSEMILHPERKYIREWATDDFKPRRYHTRLLLEALTRSDKPKFAVPYMARVVATRERKDTTKLDMQYIEGLLKALFVKGPDDIDKLPLLPDPPLSFVEEESTRYLPSPEGSEGLLLLFHLAHARQLRLDISFYVQLIDTLLSRGILYQAAAAVHMIIDATPLKWKESKANVARQTAYSQVLNAAIENLRKLSSNKDLDAESRSSLDQSVYAIAKLAQLFDLRITPSGSVTTLLDGISLIKKHDLASEEVKEYLDSVIARAKAGIRSL